MPKMSTSKKYKLWLVSWQSNAPSSTYPTEAPREESVSTQENTPPEKYKNSQETTPSDSLRRTPSVQLLTSRDPMSVPAQGKWLGWNPPTKPSSAKKTSTLMLSQLESSNNKEVSVADLNQPVWESLLLLSCWWPTP